jgi:Rrf2 family protein
VKLTRASSYALHALQYMAESGQDKPVPSHQIARDRKIPERFLLKVLKPLVSARVLRSVKGPHGGYRLAKPPSKISMLEVVEAVEGPIRGQAPLAEGSSGTDLDAKLEAVCDQAANLMKKQLGKVRVSDLLGKN